jgi:uncharacterized protein (TIGR03435 family)
VNYQIAKGLLFAVLAGISNGPEAFAQAQSKPRDTAAARPAFEVASVKVNNSNGNNTAQFTSDTLTLLHLPLANILFQAYMVPFDQMSFGSFESAFGERYDIVAKAGKPVSRDEMRLMLQTLLADRFHLSVHHEQRLRQVYALGVATSGHKLHAAAPGEESDFRVESPKNLGSDVYLRSITFKNVTMQTTAKLLMEKALENARGKTASSIIVVDKTGLTGGFDFQLEWTWEENPAGDAASLSSVPPSSLIAALRKLGLDLRGEKLPVDFLVVDHVDKAPTEN